MQELLDVLIVGAGPTGLACAIEAVANRIKVLVVEKGVLVNSVYNYPATMTFFTSRERLEIGDLPLPSLNTKPQRAEALEYYRRVADFYRLPMHFYERVMAVKGENEQQAIQTAKDSACSFISNGRDENIRCSQSAPVSVKCKHL